ncbi:MAG: hypothetical protein Q9220_005218 [cf. Caloplaca sp. 1 TL-2023]
MDESRMDIDSEHGKHDSGGSGASLPRSEPSRADSDMSDNVNNSCLRVTKSSTPGSNDVDNDGTSASPDPVGAALFTPDTSVEADENVSGRGLDSAFASPDPVANTPVENEPITLPATSSLAGQTLRYPGLQSARKRVRVNDSSEAQSGGNAWKAPPLKIHRPHAPPLYVANKRKQSILDKTVVNTRRTQYPASYYQSHGQSNIRRSDIQTMKYVVTLVDNCLHASNKDIDTELSILRRRLHQVGFYDYLNDELVTISRVLQKCGLPAVLDHPAIFPWDVRADALALINNFQVGQFDPDLLRGIITKRGTNAKNTSFKSHSLDKEYPFKASSDYVGEGRLVNGQWWPLQICTIRDGAHGIPEGGIYGQPKKGAYSVIVSGGGYSDVDDGDTIQYCGTSGQPGQPTAATYRMIESSRSHNTIRVLRSASVKSKYRPSRGYRYDGLYTVTATEILDEGTSMYRFTLERCPGQDPIRYEGVEKKPTGTEEYYYEQLRNVIA